MTSFVLLAALAFQTAEQHYNAGTEKLNLRDNEGAIADLTKAVEADPKMVKAWNNRGIGRWNTGDEEGALADFNKALELDPKYVQSLNNRGLVRTCRGEWDAALPDYAQAIQLFPKIEQSWLNRAMTLNAKGDRDAAAAAAKKVVEINPVNAGSYSLLGIIAYDKRLWKDSLGHFRKALEMGTATPVFVRMRIWILRARLGERAAGTKELTQFLKDHKPAKPEEYAVKIAAFLAGQLAEEDLLKAAESKSAFEQKRHLCDACFYVGVKRSLDKDKEGAAENLRTCLESDVRYYGPYSSARAELEALEKGK